jgi:signal peptidase I
LRPHNKGMKLTKPGELRRFAAYPRCWADKTRIGETMADESPVPKAPGPTARSPVLAGLFSLLWPGIGQLYNGSWPRALAFAVGVPLLAVTGGFVALRIPVDGFNLLGMLLGLGAHVAAVVDAARGGGIRATNRPWYSRASSCTALVLGGFVLIRPVEVLAIRSVVQAFTIPTAGMEPTVLIGDHLLVDKLAYGRRNPWSRGRSLHGSDPGNPERGDIIAFLFPEDRSRIFLKRVIGLPGETVEIRGRRVLVDGTPIEEPYAQSVPSTEPRPATPESWGPTRVPPESLFVLGDNRENSRDSRYWGFVPMADVLGEAKVVYYSVEPTHDRGVSSGVSALRLPKVRWRRFGKILG